MEKEIRHSKLEKPPENPFKKDMAEWYPNSKKLFNIASMWRDMVGEYIGANTVLLGVYKGGVLYIACANSVISGELRQREEWIVSCINNKLGPEYITKLKFNNSKFNRVNKTEEKTEKREEGEIPQSVLDDIEEKLKSVTDPELKKTIREIHINLYNRDKK